MKVTETTINLSLEEKGFDHPCKDTCSGWKQGGDRVRADLMRIVNHQAEMKSLWFLEPSLPEHHLQMALRHLHAMIEGDPALAEIAKQKYWDAEE